MPRLLDQVKKFCKSFSARFAQRDSHFLLLHHMRAGKDGDMTGRWKLVRRNIPLWSLDLFHFLVEGVTRQAGSRDRRGLYMADISIPKKGLPGRPFGPAHEAPTADSDGRHVPSCENADAQGCRAELTLSATVSMSDARSVATAGAWRRWWYRADASSAIDQVHR